jgi:hypothetical protein
LRIWNYPKRKNVWYLKGMTSMKAKKSRLQQSHKLGLGVGILALFLAQCSSGSKQGSTALEEHGKAVATSSSGSNSSDQRSPAAIDPKLNRDQAIADSSVEISYYLGHDYRQFKAMARNSSIQAQTFMNKQLLKEGSVDQGRYADLLERITSFVGNTSRSDSYSAPCRAPFTVLVRIGAQTRSLNGCRPTTDGTTLSRIAREAEFLLYSKK